jgi:UDP-GlcNAc:undecaprenyl-phosphate GlcNAc-1-phosphate transferase
VNSGLILFIICLLITLAIASKSLDIGKKFNLLDYPAEGKIHSEPIPYVGGIIIYFILSMSLLVNNLIGVDTNLYLLLYINFFFILGLIDDKFDLNSYYKILLVIIISSFFIYFDKSFLIYKIFFQIFDNEYYFGILKIPVTILCIILLYISLNMSDGINCLLISFTLIAIIFINTIVFNRYFDLVDISLLSSLIIILYFNYKNKVFLGNAGANLIAAYFIYLLINGNYFGSIDVFKIISPFMIMGIDMVRIIFIRLLKKTNPFNRDLNHFHYILYKKFNVEKTTIIYISISFFPLILNYLTNIEVLFLTFFQILTYSFIVYKLK